MPLYTQKARKKSTKRGFSLIEMLVAVTIFSLMIGSTTGLLVSAIRSQAKALSLQKILDETSFVIEYMSRDLRMAKKELNDPPICLSARGLNYDGLSGTVEFINYQDFCRAFFGEGNQIIQARPRYPLTSNDVEVTSRKFDLSGKSQTESPNLQPRVTIALTIKKAGVAKPEIKIQTTISQRNLDVVQ